ncbi:hypothetical protein G6N82_10525 [Altererythrobacter sp. BO-6]|uniref:hypothetical protein n=1 Tax=Altererythrobacter sp. BO-6 TaxID=2604537 RepID=UPI0013E13B21|nr:hypothetical protein [Altererythrobacter sp. BO-6]QIG54529.1 hypothetical protein G6N82_10525 [Altererythrobacter sp. BO-6]
MFRQLMAGAIGLAAIAGISAAPLAAQDSAALKQLDAQLPGVLVNDPSRLDWDSYGADMERTAIVDPSIPGGGAAIRFEIKRADEFIYVAGTNVPLIKNVNRGDTITVGFYARTIEARTDNGKGVIRVRFQQDLVPYPGFGEQTLEIGTEWDWYEVTAPVEMGLRRKDGIVAFQFGRTKQIIEIGQTIVVSGASRIAADAPAAAPEPAPPPPKPEPTPIPVTPQEPLIPEPLEGVGELLNDPRGGDWKVIGSADAVAQRDEPAIWLGKARRFSNGTPASDPGTLSLAIPITVDMAGGDNLLIAVAGRTEQSSAADGRAVVGLKVDDLDPERGDFAQVEFPLGGDWQLIRLRARSPRNYPAGSTQVVLQFAGSAQVVDIGPVYVFRTAPQQ